MLRLFSALALLATTVSSLNTVPGHHPISHTGCEYSQYHSAAEVVAKLGLIPNVEKGYYIQTFEDPDTINGTRSISTAIYYLLEGSVGWSYWHRVDAVEVWHFYAGAPLNLGLLFNNGTPTDVITLGPDIFHGQQPQVAIAKWQWQHAKSLGDWTLVGTTVAPGFSPNGYELKDGDWEPDSG